MKQKSADPKQVLSILNKQYPGAKCALEFNNVWQLLVATILSAQCTDKRVNIVTKGLFAQYPDPEDYNRLDLEKLKDLIKPTGFYNHKATFIKAAAAKVVNDFAGKVPDNMEDLLTLPGVARKTANVVLGVGFGKNEGIAVDTHVIRLSNLLGWTSNKTSEKIEQDLLPLFPRDSWERASTLLITHGRNICVARKPKCSICPLRNICPSALP